MQNPIRILGHLSVFKYYFKPFYYMTTKGIQYNIRKPLMRSIQSISSLNNLSKLNTVPSVDELIKYVENRNRFNSKYFNNFLQNTSFEKLKEEEAILLLQYCGKNIPNETLETRNNNCQQIYNNLKKTQKLTLNFYHCYIKICTENKFNLNYKEFLTEMLCQPNQQTYKALLANNCENGDILQAIDLLNLMKTQDLSVDEQIFSSMILVHTMKGGLKAAEGVLETMKAAKIPETTNIYFSILKGLTQRQIDEFNNGLKKFPVKLNECEFLEILKNLGITGKVEGIKTIIKQFNDNFSSKFESKVNDLCVHLIHMKQIEAAMEIYLSLVNLNPEQKYGHFLFREMLLCETPVEKIIQFAKNLKESNLNQYSLENITETVFKLKKFNLIPTFFDNLPLLRPHYFWPLIINARSQEGELGILKILKEMTSRNVKIDSETLDTYVLPFLNYSDPKFLLIQLQDLGMSLRDVLVPLLVVLLRKGHLDLAHQICTTYDNVKIENEKLLGILVFCFKTSKNTKAIVGILQRICESQPIETDLVGNYLITTIKKCVTFNDFSKYLQLLQDINEAKLRINSDSADLLHNFITVINNVKLSSEISDLIDYLQDFSKQNDPNLIPHPNSMTLTELENHLIELKHKKMETRGVIRKLIQKHSNLGNNERIQELREELTEKRYDESPGMKASIMYSYIQKRNLDSAVNLFRELKEQNFRIDTYKIIDLATLMVAEKQFKQAEDLIGREKGNCDAGIGKNCRRLLNAYEDEIEQLKMFNLLVKNSLCKASNVILGSLVRIHLNKDNIKEAVYCFIDLTKKYACTPLQLELLCAIIDSKNSELLEKTVEAITSVHGKNGAGIALFSAFAQTGLDNSLRKLILNNKLLLKELLKRYERWVNEGRVDALKTIVKACRSIPYDYVNINAVYISIMKTYALKNDCMAALAFYDELLEAEVIISKELEMELLNLLKQCKYEIPEKLKA